MRMFLISMADVEDEWDGLSEAERDRVGACHEDFQRRLGDRYVLWHGVAPSHGARTVRLRSDGRTSIAEGLVTETKEPLGCFYIFEAESMEEAIECAKQGRFRPDPTRSARSAAEGGCLQAVS